MTGGKAFTFFLILAMLTPFALMASASLAERWAPSVHRWNQRHARAINWGLALWFFAAAVSFVFRPLASESTDILDQLLYSTPGRVIAFALCALNGADYVRRGRRHNNPIYSPTK